MNLMRPIPELADSTVGMSAYNVAASGDERDFESLHKVLSAAVHPGLTREQLRRACDELVARRRFLPVDGKPDVYRVADPLGRRVVGRDRSDIREEDDGSFSGGWTGWIAQDRRRGLTPLEGE